MSDESADHMPPAEGASESLAGTDLSTIAGPLTEELVAAAQAQLRQEGINPSLRAIRERLGRGSMTTIQAFVEGLRRQEEPALPRYEPGDEDRRWALAVIGQLFQRSAARAAETADAREQALQKAVMLADQRAADATKSAEADIAVAMRHEREAREAQQRAEQHGEAAIARAAAAQAEALRQTGQANVLLQDRDRLQAQLAVTEEKLARAIANHETEIEARGAAEALAARLGEALGAAREEVARLSATAAAQAGTIEGLEQALRRAGARLVDEQTRTAQLSAEITAARAEIAALASQRDEANAAAASVRAVLAAQTNWLAKVEAQHDQAVQSVNNLEAQRQQEAAGYLAQLDSALGTIRELTARQAPAAEGTKASKPSARRSR